MDLFTGIFNADSRNLINLAPILVLVFYASRIIYNIFLHPLRHVPGPFLAKISNLWVARYWLNGKYVFTVSQAHERYGQVVRTGPNEVSFSSAQSWKDIYGHVGGRGVFLKSNWYQGVPGETPHLSSARDPHEHGLLRKTFSNGFSARALSAQEDRIHYFTDKLIQQLDKHLTQAPRDIVKWYNCVTFDIIGELALGEAFGSLDQEDLHFWVKLVFEHIKAGTQYRAFLWFPWLRAFTNVLYRYNAIPKSFIDIESRKKHNEYTRKQMAKRFQDTSEKHDFLTKPINEMNKGNLTVNHVISSANLLILAGAETSSTALSGITYYLCRNPNKFQKLKDEVRGSFNKYEEITGLKTEAMPYLRAVIDEGMRIYPPVPIGQPRVSPGETVDGVYMPKGTIVYTSSWASTHDPRNFRDPFEFRPERWLDEKSTDRKEASNPFLLGTRVCLGRSLALLDLRIVLAKLVWTFDIELHLEDSWDLDSNVFLVWEKPELPVVLSRRAGVHVTPLDGSNLDSQGGNF